LQESAGQRFEASPAWTNFQRGFKSESTRNQYTQYILKLFTYLKMGPDAFVQKAEGEGCRWAEQQIMGFLWIPRGIWLKLWSVTLDSRVRIPLSGEGASFGCPEKRIREYPDRGLRGLRRLSQRRGHGNAV